MQFYSFVNLMVLVSRFERIVLQTFKCGPYDMNPIIWTIRYDMNNMIWAKSYGSYRMVNIIMFCDSIWTFFQLVIATIRDNDWRKRFDEWRCLHCTKLDEFRFQFLKFRRNYPRIIRFLFRIALPNTKIRVNLASVDMILCCASL